VADLYEFGITGTIGPLIADSLPEFSIVAETQWTVLTGTVNSPDELQLVLDLLNANGSPPLDIRITPGHPARVPAASSSERKGGVRPADHATRMTSSR
jgi:hypothetical protein